MSRPATWPELGPELPRRGNRASRVLARGVLGAAGWQVEGALPDLPKCVLIVAPHTSNWDFVVGVLAIFALGVRVAWIGKRVLFRPPFGRLMRWLGGIAVDRREPRGAVAQVVERFAASERLLLGLSPEGTRRRVERWKSGYYYIALDAGVPIVPVSFDYSRRTIAIGAPLEPGGDLEADSAQLGAFFSGIRARRPDRTCLSATH